VAHGNGGSAQLANPGLYTHCGILSAMGIFRHLWTCRLHALLNAKVTSTNIDCAELSISSECSFGDRILSGFNIL
jgi:hypothetical protein